MFQYDDINQKLLSCVDPRAVSSRTVIFYMSRRHWLEVLAEFIQSATSIATVVALAGVFDLGDLNWVWMALAMYFLANPFLLELWRWHYDIYYLTQDGYRRSFFTFKSLSYQVEELSFVTSARVQQLMYHKLLGFDIGILVAKTPDGRQLSTPLMPHPLRLQNRISEAKGWKPKPPDEKPRWRS